MPIKVGNSLVKKAYVGEDQVDKIYLGENVVFNSGNNVPDYTTSFDAATEGFNTLYDFLYGTAAVPQNDNQTAIKNVTDLAQHFKPYSNNAGQFIINKEVQRYQPFSSSENFVFEADSLNLTATLHGGTLPAGIVTKNPSSNVSYSRTVPIADTSNIKVGQITGVGAKQYDNLHRTGTYHISGTVSNGDTVTQTFSAVDNTFAETAVSVTADGASTITSLAAAIVAAINANSTCQANKITAYVLPNTPGGYGVSIPKKSLSAPNDYGLSGKGSLRNVVTVTSKTGTVAHDFRQTVYFTYVVSKTSSTVTLSHPVDILTSDTITFSPAIVYSVESTILPATVINVGDASAVSAGQLVFVSYQDTNLLRIASVASTSFTLASNLYAGGAVLIVVLPIFAALTNGVTSNTNVLNFAAVPSGVAAGQVMFNYYAEGNTGQPKVVSKTSTTVTLDTNVTLGSGDLIYFLPPIYSGQIWSKFITMPDDNERKIIALELTCEISNAADVGSWPAFWMFSDTTDPSPGGGSGTSEIDVIDLFTYFNNASTNCYYGATSTPNTNLYRHPDYIDDGHLRGNNTGRKERKLQLIWTKDKAFFYLDGLLIVAKSFTWNTHYRAQFAANLAIGSVNTSFNGNGFFPLDCSQFPLPFKLKRMRFLQTPGDEMPYING